MSRKRMEGEEIELNMEDKEVTVTEEMETVVRDTPVTTTEEVEVIVRDAQGDKLEPNKTTEGININNIMEMLQEALKKTVKKTKKTMKHYLNQ